MDAVGFRDKTKRERTVQHWFDGSNFKIDEFDATVLFPDGYVNCGFIGNAAIDDFTIHVSDLRLFRSPRLFSKKGQFKHFLAETIDGRKYVVSLNG
jgi:hypothetical protein